MVPAPLGELVRHGRFFQLGLGDLAQAPGILRVQFVALTVSVRLGHSAGHLGRWIEARARRVADLSPDSPTLPLLTAVALAGRGGVVANGHVLLIGR